MCIKYDIVIPTTVAVSLKLSKINKFLNEPNFKVCTEILEPRMSLVFVGNEVGELKGKSGRGGTGLG